LDFFNLCLFFCFFWCGFSLYFRLFFWFLLFLIFLIFWFILYRNWHWLIFLIFIFINNELLRRSPFNKFLFFTFQSCPLLEFCLRLSVLVKQWITYNCIWNDLTTFGCNQFFQTVLYYISELSRHISIIIVQFDMDHKFETIRLLTVSKSIHFRYVYLSIDL